jgi:hypothetical protein
VVVVVSVLLVVLISFVVFFPPIDLLDARHPGPHGRLPRVVIQQVIGPPLERRAVRVVDVTPRHPPPPFYPQLDVILPHLAAIVPLADVYPSVVLVVGGRGAVVQE